MPLIMLCGGPLSGKTLISQKLEKKAKELYPDREVQVLSHETLAISRQVFRDMPTEKKFNQKLLSLVEQALTTRRVVIVDFICLTKSLRYQLYGKANFVGTNSCVVHCTTPYEVTLEFNKAGQNNNNNNNNNTAQQQQQQQQSTHKKQFYTDAIFEDLWNRLEVPLDTCKWDYPCYPIDCSDITPFLSTAATNDDNTNNNNNNNTNDINDAFYANIITKLIEVGTKNVSRGNLPTRSEGGGFVAVLDKITTSIVEQIIAQQQSQGFVVGALLETHSINVTVDIAPFLTNSNSGVIPNINNTNNTNNTPTDNVENNTTDLTTAMNNVTIDDNNNSTAAQSTQAPSSGLKLVRKVRGGGAVKKTTTTDNTSTTNNETNNNIKTKYTLIIKNPITPSGLFELKQSFTRIATMMNVKSADQMAKAFVEYLQPQLNPL